jgi:uncharacterized protein YndB with AHSA1/START domain
MTDRSATHATFTLERVYAAAPAEVFAAWSDPDAKARWFAGSTAQHDLDFSVGGREVTHGVVGDKSLTFDTVYRDIVPGERIVYSSSLFREADLMTVTLTTVQFQPEDGGTRLVLTEQGAYLDGHEDPSWREQGTRDHLAALDAELRHEPSTR